jgi:hypothetical protein
MVCYWGSTHLFSYTSPNNNLIWARRKKHALPIYVAASNRFHSSGVSDTAIARDKNNCVRISIYFYQNQ